MLWASRHEIFVDLHYFYACKRTKLLIEVLATNLNSAARRRWNRKSDKGFPGKNRSSQRSGVYLFVFRYESLVCVCIFFISYICHVKQSYFVKGMEKKNMEWIQEKKLERILQCWRNETLGLEHYSLDAFLKIFDRKLFLLRDGKRRLWKKNANSITFDKNREYGNFFEISLHTARYISRGTFLSHIKLYYAPTNVPETI